MTLERDATSPAAPRSPWARLWPLAVIVALGALAWAMGWHRAISLETLVQRRSELDAFVQTHYAAALLGYIAVYVVAVAISLPGSVFLTLAGGVMFGWLVAGAATVVGATVGATLLFLIVRYALSDLVRRRFGARVAAFAAGFRAQGFSYLLLLRLVPVFPFSALNLMAALVGMRLRDFVGATALGIIPGTFAFAVCGAGLDSIIGAQEAAYRACLAAGRTDCRLDFDLRAALTPEVIAALTALGIIALIPLAVRRWRAQSQA